jgi:predicted TIM-barrel fold metal-dependent hydrolase
MTSLESLTGSIQSLSIIDTHEHLPLEKDLPKKGVDVLESWLIHYFCRDLVSAGLLPQEVEKARRAADDLSARWKILESAWHAARSTGYGRCLAIAARDLFGIESINAGTIVELNRRLGEARSKPQYYRWILGEKSRIAVSIRDTSDEALPEAVASPDPFVFALRTDPFIMPTHLDMMRTIGERVGVSVRCLEDWEETARRTIERYLAEPGRVVSLKSGLAYLRNLHYRSVTRAEAEAGFNLFLSEAHAPAWRPHACAPVALQDHMQHVICRIADEHGLVYQIHTGLQEGNGNVISDSNPTLLTNLFLLYPNVRFDLFHSGYPYIMEAGNLAKNFRNVFLDMCWTHIISPEASRRALVEWLDAVPANKIMAFGGDFCFPEGVYGHQVMARANVAAALDTKVRDGSMDLERATEIARWLFVDNPATLFGLRKYG